MGERYENYRQYGDGELIDRLRRGETPIMDYICDKYKNLVRSKAKSMFILGADSEDLIQEGMIGLFKAIRDYDCGRDASFYTFADLCDDYITQAASGEPYDVDHLPEAPFSAGGCLLMAFGAAFLVSLIATGIMKGQLKTVRSQREADNYIRQGSTQLTKRSDRFLYRHVDRRRKAEKKETDKEGGSTTHTSSSGTTHGGSGGKF